METGTVKAAAYFRANPGETKGEDTRVKPGDTLTVTRNRFFELLASNLVEDDFKPKAAKTEGGK